MQNKRRPPIEQLRAAGKLAKELLVERHIIAKDSVIDEMINNKDAPTLPGIPAYLPHQWTLKAAQHMMYDFLLMWRDKCKDNDSKAEDITEFFKMVITEFRRQEHLYNKEIVAMPKLLKAMKTVPVLKDIFSPMRKKETVRSIQRFFIDSFAVSVVLKHNHSVSEYANWFLEWTEEMHKLWIKPEDRSKTP